MKEKTGTREWSEHSSNCMIGKCSNACRYCYAEEWYKRWRKPFPDPEIFNDKAMGRVVRKQGVVMFPTRHDITPSNFQYTMPHIMALLKKGNKVLVVTKPSFKCIPPLLAVVADYKAQLEFRFTIGTDQAEHMKFWEPNAPSLKERMRCLTLAHYSGFRVSVSAEPLLTPWSARDLYDMVAPYIETIWIGKLNNADSRVKVDRNDHNLNTHLDLLEAFQSDASVKKIAVNLTGCLKVRWKDSYKKVLGTEGPTL